MPNNTAENLRAKYGPWAVIAGVADAARTSNSAPKRNLNDASSSPHSRPAIANRAPSPASQSSPAAASSNAPAPRSRS